MELCPDCFKRSISLELRDFILQTELDAAEIIEQSSGTGYAQLIYLDRQSGCEYMLRLISTSACGEYNGISVNCIAKKGVHISKLLSAHPELDHLLTHIELC